MGTKVASLVEREGEQGREGAESTTTNQDKKLGRMKTLGGLTGKEKKEK